MASADQHRLAPRLAVPISKFPGLQREGQGISGCVSESPVVRTSADPTAGDALRPSATCLQSPQASGEFGGTRPDTGCWLMPVVWGTRWISRPDGLAVHYFRRQSRSVYGAPTTAAVPQRRGGRANRDSRAESRRISEKGSVMTYRHIAVTDAVARQSLSRLEFAHAILRAASARNESARSSPVRGAAG